MTEKPDMTLVINIDVTGTIDDDGNLNLTSRYSQGESNPPSADVVQPDGNIDLTKMAYDAERFSVDTDLTFHLSGRITAADEQPVSFAFASPIEKAVTITNRNGGPTVGMTPSFPRAGDLTTLSIDDENNDACVYDYCLTIATQGGQSVELDPSIVNRGS